MKIIFLWDFQSSGCCFLTPQFSPRPVWHCLVFITNYTGVCGRNEAVREKVKGVWPLWASSVLRLLSRAGSEDGRVHVWSTESGMKVAVLDGKHPGPINTLQFNPRYMTFASACTNTVRANTLYDALRDALLDKVLLTLLSMSIFTVFVCFPVSLAPLRWWLIEGWNGFPPSSEVGYLHVLHSTLAQLQLVNQEIQKYF